MPSARAPIPILSSIAALAATSDAWLVDIWGVLHDGLAPHACALDACVRFRATGGIVVLISNAPRPASATRASLDRIGVPMSVCDAIVTSGDVSRHMLEASRPKSIHHIGPERDLGIFAELGIAFASAQAAHTIVCTGPLDDETETPEDYRPLLTWLARTHRPFLCANPDIVVERGKRLVTCAGALAALYADLGGPVTYAGKPHAAIYERADAVIAGLEGAPVPRTRMLAIGDGIHTDILGAHRAGIRQVYIRSGVHAQAHEPLTPDLLRRLFDGPPTPAAAMPALAW